MIIQMEKVISSAQTNWGNLEGFQNLAKRMSKFIEQNQQQDHVLTQLLVAMFRLIFKVKERLLEGNTFVHVKWLVGKEIAMY